VADKKTSKTKPDANPQTPKPEADQALADHVSADDDQAVETVGGDTESVAKPSQNDALPNPDISVETSNPDTDDEPDLPENGVVTEPRPDEELSPDTEQQISASVDGIAPPVPEKIVERVIERRGGGFPAVIGGVIAAVLGFLAGSSNILNPYLPDAWRSADPAAAIAALEGKLSDQSGQLTDLADQVGAIKVPDVSSIDSQAAETAATVTAMTATLEGLKAQVTELETRPISEGISEQAIAAFEQDLQATQDAFAAQRAALEQLVLDAREKEINATEVAQSAAARAALAQIQSALDSGAGFSDALGALQATGTAVPDALIAAASDGVASNATLRDGFPDAARAALAAARSAGEDAGLGSFLVRQLGARSVSPRQGDDPDAVLSRAEAALASGELDVVLNELNTLPDPAKSELAGWVAQAEARMTAVKAVSDLTQTLNIN
jgi:hypothetical protein